MAADWSIEPAAAWVPCCDLQLANGAMQPSVCYPGLPVEYASTEMFGNSIQPSIPASEGGQMVEYGVATMYDSVATAEHQYVVDFHDTEEIISCNLIQRFEELADEYKVDVGMMGRKIHRYPASIRALGLSERYTAPMVVAIGPYHHDRDHLKQTEKLKCVAAYYCIRNSGRGVQTLYDAVVSKAHDAGKLYDADVVEGITDKDFVTMMFFDACFLVQYMLSMSDPNKAEMDDSLRSFFDANDNEIFHDMMLLENQLPWPVVQAVMEFVPVRLREFIYCLKGCLQDRKEKAPEEEEEFEMDPSYEPPHLLGLLRFYIVGRRRSTEAGDLPGMKSISFSVSANELAEIGIALKPNKTTEVVHMGLESKGTLFGELFLAPVSLDSQRASCLINMAAFELCTTPNFSEAKDEDSAVCSYLLLLAMLVDREEDVQELRTKRFLQGGGGLTNSEALYFFTSIQGLRLGSCYVRTMAEIEKYRIERKTWTSVHAFFYRNFKVIAAVLSAIVTIVSILGTLISLKN